MRLRDKVAIVTGAGSGIGAAGGVAMAAEGGRVLVADINEAGAKATVQKIEGARGQAIAVTADVTRAADNQALVERATAAWGRLDVFFANAGVPQWKTDVEEVDEKTFDSIFDVNVKGVYLGAKYALPVMKRAGRGVFLITASTAAIRPRPGGQIYAASKGAVVTLAKALALEAALPPPAGGRGTPWGDAFLPPPGRGGPARGPLAGGGAPWKPSPPRARPPGGRAGGSPRPPGGGGRCGAPRSPPPRPPRAPASS